MLGALVWLFPSIFILHIIEGLKIKLKRKERLVELVLSPKEHQTAE